VRDTFNKKKIDQLKVGEVIVAEGLEVRRTNNCLVFYASKQVHGKRLRERLGSANEKMNLTKARKYLQQMVVLIPDAINSAIKNPNITFQEASSHYLSTLEQSGGKGILQKTQQFRMHLVPHFKKLKIKNISTLDVDKFVHKRSMASAAISTINRELATLRHMLNQLSDWNVLETKHIKVKNRSGEERRCGTFDKTQIHKMIECSKNDSDPYTYFFILIGFQTSMRHKEILRIKFEHFNHESKFLHVPEAKTGSRQVPVHDDLLNVIRIEQERRGKDTGFLFAAKSATGHRSYMKKQFQRVLVAAELQNFGFVPHSMRHTAISIVMRTSISVADAMRISGHKSPQMLLHYTHHDNQSVKLGLNALAEATSQPANATNGDIAA
jgi:integrase